MHSTCILTVAAAFAAGSAFAQTEPAAPAAEEPAAAAAETGVAEPLATARAALKGVDGADHGTVTLTQTIAGVLVRAELSGLPPGPHGFHFHEVGQCEPPFETAGGHYNPTNVNHGFQAEGGPHVGDMPNVHAPETGSITVEHLNAFVSLSADSGNTLFDDDGTALVLHAAADDYASQPSGQSGDRIACGVIER